MTENPSLSVGRASRPPLVRKTHPTQYFSKLEADNAEVNLVHG